MLMSVLFYVNIFKIRIFNITSNDRLLVNDSV